MLSFLLYENPYVCLYLLSHIFSALQLKKTKKEKQGRSFSAQNAPAS